MNHITTDAEGSQEATEAKILAGQLIAHADNLAGLIIGFTEEGETELATAFAEVALAFRLVVDTLGDPVRNDEALDRLTAANARARTALASARARRGQ